MSLLFHHLSAFTCSHHLDGRVAQALRNGNDYFTRLIGETMQLKEIVSPHPIKEY